MNLNWTTANDRCYNKTLVYLCSINLMPNLFWNNSPWRARCILMPNDFRDWKPLQKSAKFWHGSNKLPTLCKTYKATKLKITSMYFPPRANFRRIIRTVTHTQMQVIFRLRIDFFTLNFGHVLMVEISWDFSLLRLLNKTTDSLVFCNPRPTFIFHWRVSMFCFW